MDVSESPYSRFCEEELILRDYLAAHRTVLANERTLLAYLRTTLTLLIGGASFVQFFDSLFVRTMGWAFIPISVAVFLVGLVKYQAMRRSLAQIGSERPERPSHAPQ